MHIKEKRKLWSHCRSWLWWWGWWWGWGWWKKKCSICCFRFNQNYKKKNKKWIEDLKIYSTISKNILTNILFSVIKYKSCFHLFLLFGAMFRFYPIIAKYWFVWGNWRAICTDYISVYILYIHAYILNK